MGDKTHREARNFIVECVMNLLDELRKIEEMAVVRNDPIAWEHSKQINIKIDGLEAVRRLIDRSTKKITPRAGFIAREYIFYYRENVAKDTVSYLLELIQSNEIPGEPLEWID